MPHGGQVTITTADADVDGQQDSGNRGRYRATARHRAVAHRDAGTAAALVVEDDPDMPILRKPYQCDDLDQAIEAALLAVAATTTPPAEN